MFALFFGDIPDRESETVVFGDGLYFCSRSRVDVGIFE